MVHIALLRAVNVGGRAVPMARLREMLADLGLENPRTLLQSGNAVFESSKTPAALEGLLEKGSAKALGLETAFFVRSSKQWRELIAANPFTREAKDDPSHLLVLPLKGSPGKAEVKALRDAIKGRERVEVVGRTAYAVYPDGIGNSKLTLAIIERHLGTPASGRNWNTVQKLAALAG